MTCNVLSIPLLLAVASACAQAPANPPAPSSATQVTETSRISRFVAGPGDRPQGLILRNGTFVSLSPGLAQRLPLEMSKSAQVQVAGDEFTYSRTKTIQARTITIAGVSYTDDAPRIGPDGAGPVGPVDGPPPPPREVGGPRSGPRPPRPCDAPPPPPAGTGPADGQPAMTPGVPPPPPPSGGAPSPKPQGL